MPRCYWRRRVGALGVLTLLALVLAVPSAPVPAVGVRPGPPAGQCTVGTVAVAPPQRGHQAGQDVVHNDASGRRELVVPHPSQVAVLIGDSQAAGAAGVAGDRTWPQLALRAAGYTVAFRGRGGTGFATGNGSDPDYVAALRQEHWLLPHGDVGLVVVEGGGNDARTGAPDAAIVAGEAALVAELRRSYPRSPIVIVGTLAHSARDGGGRRHQVDALLGGAARRQGLAFVSAGSWLTTHKLAAHLADQVHLDSVGHRLAARALLQALAEAGLGRKGPAMTP